MSNIPVIDLTKEDNNFPWSVDEFKFYCSKPIISGKSTVAVIMNIDMNDAFSDGYDYENIDRRISFKIFKATGKSFLDSYHVEPIEIVNGLVRTKVYCTCYLPE